MLNFFFFFINFKYEVILFYLQKGTNIKQLKNLVSLHNYHYRKTAVAKSRNGAFNCMSLRLNTCTLLFCRVKFTNCHLMRTLGVRKFGVRESL